MIGFPQLFARTRNLLKNLRQAMVLVMLATTLAVVAPGADASHEDPAAPNDPFFTNGYLWGITQTAAEKAWDRSTGQDAIVAVVDTGVDFGHEDLLGKVIRGASFVPCDDDDLASCKYGGWPGIGETTTADDAAHATHVAGTIAAIGNNGKGVVGVAPDARILTVRVLDEGGSGTTAGVASGIRYAADNLADVINLSLGSGPGEQAFEIIGPDDVLVDAVRYATNKGSLVIASAGNDSFPLCGRPAWDAGALCVTATDRRQAPAILYSNDAVKPGLDSVAAPGGSLLPICRENVISTVPAGTASTGRTSRCGLPTERNYDEFAGTSMAAPHVSGVAALLFAQGCTRSEAFDILKTTSRTPFVDQRGVWTTDYGWGIVDADAATSAAASICTPPGPNIAPVANNDSATTNEDTPTMIDVIANDTDADLDPLTVHRVSDGEHGTVTNNGDGTVTYTPDLDYFGTDEFTYEISDGTAAFIAATVAVVISPVDDGPRAADDIAFFESGVPLVVSVTANDVDPEGDAFAITADSPATNGTAVWTATNLTYTSNPNYRGADPVFYIISNAGGESTARVSLFGPDCLTDFVDNIEGTPVIASVGGEPVGDEDNPFSRGWSDDLAENGNLITTLWFPHVDTAAHSAVQSFFSDAASPDLKDDRLVAPPNQTLSPNSRLIFWHRFLFEKSSNPENATGFDGGVLEISSDGGFTWNDVTEAGGTFLDGGYTNPISPDFGSPIAGRQAWSGSSSGDYPTPPSEMTRVEVELGALSGKTVLLRWRLALDPFVIGTLPGAGWWIDDVQITDTVTKDCVDQANAILPPFNHEPTANDDVLLLNQDTSRVAAVLSNDTDPDGDPLIILGVTPALHGTVVNNSTSLLYTPDAGYFGPDTFDYSISDGRGGTSTATVSVDVNGNPTAVDDSASTTAPFAVTISVLANDADPESNPLIVSGFTQPGGGIVTCSVSECVYTPRVDFFGDDSFQYTVCDARAACDSATVSLSVAQDVTPPDPPEIVAPKNGELHGLVVLLAGRAEPGSRIKLYENGSVRWEFITSPGGTWGGGGSWPDGMHTITTTATDGAGNVSSASEPVTFEVDITPPTLDISTPNNTLFITPLDSFTIEGTSTDNRGVVRVTLRYVDMFGRTVRAVNAVCPACHPTTGKSVTWSDTPTNLATVMGTITVEVIAYDEAGNRTIDQITVRKFGI